MKFIHLTDTHVIGGGRMLYGANPARWLARAGDSINTEHGDAAFSFTNSQPRSLQSMALLNSARSRCFSANSSPTRMAQT
jgi:hypothetical protein